VSLIKVIFHIDDLEKWDITLANAHNLFAGGDEHDFEVEVLTNGPAVEAFKNLETTLERRMRHLAEKGVKLRVCRNSLESHSIEAKLLPSYWEIVPIGVLELATRQKAGFAYIKP
jgi:intracellular sulfur oxidation DsrE/DsrF family protein